MPVVAAPTPAAWTEAPHESGDEASCSRQSADDDAAGQLVRQALAGDPHAFGELIDRHERAALAVAYAATRDAALAADAVQEAFLKAWHKRDSLVDPERFAGWLLHIVHRCAVDQVRSRKPVQSLARDDGGPGNDADAAQKLLKNEVDQRIRGALDELDEESRLAVVMRYYDNSSAKEIAQVLGCSAAAVDMRLKRARDKLRKRLSNLNQHQ